MKSVSKKMGVMLIALLSIGLISFVIAAEQNRPGGAGDGTQQRRGFFQNPQQMQQRMMDMYKSQLNVPDDEWKIIEPKLSKVVTLLRDAAVRRMMGFGGRQRGGPGGPQGPGEDNQPQSEVQKATDELQQTLEKTDAGAADIKAKLTALRAAREKTKQELLVAQEELRSVLTTRQEAQMVLAGILE